MQKKKQTLLKKKTRKKTQLPPNPLEVKVFLAESNAIEGITDANSLQHAEYAWKFAYKNRRAAYDLQYIFDIHRELLCDLNPRIAGQLRRCDVYIGGQRKFFISEGLLELELFEWAANAVAEIRVANSNNATDAGKELLAKQLHVQFEAIHPFEDGNGRTGRILYNIHRLLLGLPLHIIRTGKEQTAYYQWFRSHV